MNLGKSYVTFEQAKKLKEKGFDVECDEYYLEDGIDYSYTKPENWNLKPDTVSRPEQWQVVEWLRVNHGIHLGVSCDAYGKFWYANLNVCSKEVWEDEDKRHNILSAHYKFNNEHKSSQEAYSAAFDYILNNLI